MTDNSTDAGLAVFIMLVCLIHLLSVPARAEEIKEIKAGLKLVETKTGLVPELCWDDPREWVILPGTKIKAGSFRYIYGSYFSTRRRDKKKIEIADETCKAGLLFDDALYYVDYPDYPDHGGDTNFGVYKDYFLMDSWAYGASHNRTMFLFKYDKRSARLLDWISVPVRVEGVSLDFMSDYVRGNKAGYDRSSDKSPVWMDIADIDRDGRPELAIKITQRDYYDETVFKLFFEIKDDRLRLDLNSALYRPLFVKEKKGKGFKRDAYYIYGFLAKEFTLDEVKAMLKDEVGKAEAARFLIEKYDAKYDQYERVVQILESIDEWFHYRETKLIDYKPEELIKYQIKRR